MDDWGTGEDVETVLVNAERDDVFFTGHEEVRNVVTVAFLCLEGDMDDATLIAIEYIQLW